jgi:glycosyltransferase involved in cell wall biosynthesis
MSIAVAQLGARMHYAVPRILHEAGLLERLYTDICAKKDWPRLVGLVPSALRPARLKRLAARVPKGIPSHRITAFTGFGLEYARRLARARSAEERDAAFIWSGREFCRHVNHHGLGEAKAVYVFNSAGLEILHEARRRGRKGIIAEWAAADLIVCGSDWVKEGIVSCGGEKARCVVVPYGLDEMAAAPEKTKRTPGPLRVLTVGAIGLRKGSPHVLAAAKTLAGQAEFRMVGAVQILPGAEKELRRFAHLTGIVPRSEIASHFKWADVFLLPSLCEGSATSTYEAMAHGLPVICTPQTGSVARDGVDGFIVPARDSQIMAEKLATLAADPARLAVMSASAREHSAGYTLEKYGQRLLAAFREHDMIS